MHNMYDVLHEISITRGDTFILKMQSMCQSFNFLSDFGYLKKKMKNNNIQDLTVDFSSLAAHTI